MAEENCHPNVTQQRPATWRTGVYNASQPTSNAVQQRTTVISKTTEPPLPMTQPINFPSTSSEVHSKTNPTEQQTNAAKIIPRFKSSFKARPIIPQSQPLKQTSGSRTVPNFKAVNNQQPSQSKSRVHQPVQQSNTRLTVVTNENHSQVPIPKPNIPQEKRPNFQIQNDPTMFELDPVKPPVRPIFNTSAITPKFTPNMPKPIAPVGKTKPYVKKNTPSTPKQRKVKRPSTPKMTPSNSLSDSGLGSSLSCSPFPSNTNSQFLNSSRDMIPPTPSTPITKRPTDMVRTVLPQCFYTTACKVQR